MKKFIILFSLLLVTTGCAAKYPQTLDEFKVFANGSYGTIETIEVNKSINFIKKKYKKYAKKCLDKTTKVTSQTRSGSFNTAIYIPKVDITEYNPTLKIKKNSLTLYIQKDPVSNKSWSKQLPDKGMYLGIVEITKINSKKSKMYIHKYKDQYANKTMWKAIKGWADGTVKGCPDLSKQ